MEPDPDAPVFAFEAGRLLLVEAGLAVPRWRDLPPAHMAVTPPLSLGPVAGRKGFALGLGAASASPAGGRLGSFSLREVFARVADEEVVAMAARAAQLVEWWLAHSFCGRCGSPTEGATGGSARACPACGALHFPRINPAVITLVHGTGGRILLAGDRRFRRGFFALLAGFVEPGETLEEAVVREVREEVGLEVDDVRYFGSQCWPFPSQLMVGFTARHAGGEIQV